MLERCSAVSDGGDDAGNSLSGNSGSGCRVGALREKLTAALRAWEQLALPRSSSEGTLPLAQTRFRPQEPHCDTSLLCAERWFVDWTFYPLVPRCLLVPRSNRPRSRGLTPEQLASFLPGLRPKHDLERGCPIGLRSR